MEGAEERLKILEMIASGQISASEGVALLEALQQNPADLETPVNILGPVQLDASPSSDFDSQDHLIIEDDLPNEPTLEWESDHRAGETAGFDAAVGTERIISAREEAGFREEPLPPQVQKWQRWQWIPLGVGVGFTILGSLLMFWAIQAGLFSFWFACAWLPFLIGIGLIFLSAGLRGVKWLHLRIHQGPGVWPANIRISLPLPLGTIVWMLGMAGRWIPTEQAQALKAAVMALQSAPGDQPIFLEVDEGDNGERVEIFIG